MDGRQPIIFIESMQRTKHGTPMTSHNGKSQTANFPILKQDLPSQKQSSSPDWERMSSQNNNDYDKKDDDGSTKK